MKKLGLIGKDISYSLSPKLHKLIASKQNYFISYELIDILETDLIKYIKLLKDGVYQGYNVTVPYKETIIKHLDKLSNKAKEIGSVNTVYLNKEGFVVGDNTDSYGFNKLIENNFILNKNINKVYILGSGGASRTVYYNLTNKNIKCIVVSRNKQNVKKFNEVISYEEFYKIKEIDLLINSTPVGTALIKGSPIKFKDQEINFIIDLIYNPLQTKLMTYAKNSINGLEMLIYQALKSHNIMLNKNNNIIDDKKLFTFLKEALLHEFNR